MALLNFLGAIQQVTGSCYLIETYDKKNILLECGMQQGTDNDNNHDDNDNDSKGSAFTFNPEHIDAVVISHAHIDHSGMLPRLVAEGFRGPIFATDATCELMELMLLDAAHIQEKDTEWENRWRARRGKKAIKPLYVSKDAERVLKQRKFVDYEVLTQVVPGVKVSFHDAGHIIGSAVVKLEFTEPNDSVRTLVFSGDLGSTCSPLMKSPAILKHADVLLLESTYGDRDHRCNDDTLDELVGILEQAEKDGGNVMIPAFSVGRTQDILFHLGRFYQEGRLPQHTVYLDSPMAIRANDIYYRHRDDFDEYHRAMLIKHNIHTVHDWLPILKLTPTPQESMAINEVKSGAIIVAGSGMCNGGRIIHHFKHNLWRTDCHIIFTGFQARGTNGRAIVDGAKTVRVFREDIMVGAQVHTLGGFSAHAGQSQLIEWASHFENHPELHLIHGELDKMLILQSEFKKRLDWDVNIPELGDRIAL
ncbi:MBL fold metallo-hydrolase [Pseudomonas sp. C27(2019)]|uniref:MBL fold metallo-hydrolase RNA specificity domain-containing protein n=1 Tax=Pseudomonas sp. C27(2019) TaxID=2604941 RepID=UPI001244B58D|nr:MBL fold metallo-hydrolase [Pseudomonas sp. C27(2019)]QEY59003.1 MBL fold metallo-hydrolase [Pseudomonas sp. C27(2019)]